MADTKNLYYLQILLLKVVKNKLHGQQQGDKSDSNNQHEC